MSKAMILTASLACLCAAMSGGPGRSADEPGAKLSGSYVLVAGEKDGKKEPAERIQGTTVRFTDDTIVVADKNKKEVYVATYKLDTSKKPWHITMTSKEASTKSEVAKGLVEKDGDTIKLIYALPGADAPTDFKTKDKENMFVMKKAEK